MATSCRETGCRGGKDLVLCGEYLLASAIAAQERGHGDEAVSAAGGSQGFVTDPADLKGGPKVGNGAGRLPGLLFMSHVTCGVLLDTLRLPVLLHWEASCWQLSRWLGEEAVCKRSGWSQRQHESTPLKPPSVLEDMLRQVIVSAQPPGPCTMGVRGLDQNN